MQISAQLLCPLGTGLAGKFELPFERAHMRFVAVAESVVAAASRLKRSMAMNARKFALVIAGLALAIPQAPAIAKVFDAKLWNGNWQLNVAKSKFSSADYTVKSDTRTYAVSGTRVRLNASTVGAKGKLMKWGYVAVANGKPYPAHGNPNIDHIVVTMVSPSEFKTEGQLKGKAVSQSTVSVSAAGLTIHRNVLNAKGGATDDNEVFDRVK